MTSAPETFGFDADIQQLLRLIINAFYSDKSVFLRELLSNASDALDKSRLQGLTANTPAASELSIRVSADKASKTLSIEDSGIGMTREELIKNLGTVARSGTRAFVEALEKGTDPKLIGQFGVGFYSAFLVANSVEVLSSGDGRCHRWSSSADGSFSVAEAPEADLLRGTRVLLRLKDGAEEYLEEARLRSLISRHCGFITYPIRLAVEVKKSPPEGKPEDKPEDKPEGKPEPLAPKDPADTVLEFVQVNETQPVWTKPPAEVSEEEYKSFYKAISNDWDDFAIKRHFVGEGTVEFQALLFVPKHPPFDMLMGVAAQGSKQRNIKLYSRKVLIFDEFDDFLPPYLGFVKGVVNCDDIPLNVSRELLQDNKLLKIIARNLVKRCIEMFAELAGDDAKYRQFYDAFSTNIKLGIHEDASNREKLLDLLRVPSSKSVAEDAAAAVSESAQAPTAPGQSDSRVSLRTYVDRMPKEQKDIFVLTGENIMAISKSPFLESFAASGQEVLFLAEPIDEYILAALGSTPYKGFKFVNISKEDSIEPINEESKAQSDAEALPPVCELLKQALAGKVAKVVMTQKLVQSPCALVVPQYAHSANMERIMRAQALQSAEQRLMMNMPASRTLLVNPQHRLTKWLDERAQRGVSEALKDAQVVATAQLFFDTAVMSCGFSLEDPAAVASRIQELLISKL